MYFIIFVKKLYQYDWGNAELGIEKYMPQQIYRHYNSVEEDELPVAKWETW